jgi:hypothetical protein
MSEKKIELIAQLLAKAEQTTPEEAEALTEHAERLMVKYAIDQAVIDERRAKKGGESEKIIQVRMDFTGVYRGEMINLGSNVVNGLGTLRALQNTGGNGKVFSLFLIGFESDVQQAQILINSLQVQSAVAVGAWWKLNKATYSMDNSYAQEKARRSFVHGFGSGAGNRIFLSREKVVQESATGTELVLVSRKSKVDERVASLSAGKARSRNATGRDGAAMHGYKAGQNANTGGKSMTQGRGISA